MLAAISYKNIAKIDSSSWDSKHPPGAPYFLEYLPLVQESGGVINFDRSFSYERFIPSSGLAGPISEPEATYVRGLVDHAEHSGRVPVLTATRSLGRVAGLKSAFPGLHVLLYRNLHQQWCSYSELALNGNRYFIDTVFQIIHNNRHDPVVNHLSDLFLTDDRSPSSTNMFYLFLFLHIYLYSHAADAADLIIDTNRLALDETYRHEIEGVFAGQNLQVDFSDSHQATAYSLLDFPCRNSLTEQVRIARDVLQGESLTEKGRSFATKIVDEFFEEYDRHEFYNHRIRRFLKSTLRDKETALGESEQTRKDSADLRSERDRLAADRDHLERERDDAVSAAEEVCRRTESERDALLAERDHLILQKDEWMTAAEQMRGQADFWLGERDALATDRETIETERDRISRDIVALTAERDRLTNERDAAREAHGETERMRALLEERNGKLTRWSVAFHDSTAASLSWRLTRPLRWIGIGRPKRPPKPDFL